MRKKKQTELQFLRLKFAIIVIAENAGHIFPAKTSTVPLVLLPSSLHLFLRRRTSRPRPELYDVGRKLLSLSAKKLILAMVEDYTWSPNDAARGDDGKVLKTRQLLFVTSWQQLVLSLFILCG